MMYVSSCKFSDERITSSASRNASLFPFFSSLELSAIIFTTQQVAADRAIESGYDRIMRKLGENKTDDARSNKDSDQLTLLALYRFLIRRIDPAPILK